MFFPQLVAGPIERPQNILYQFYEKHKPDPHMIKRGLQLILWGLFKKIVIADRLAHFVDIVYNDPYNFHGPLLILATIFFAFQIYCDFSGYSDMAIGTASILGFRLMRNFDKPYISTSLAEFWRRWHISLSTWFRDYVYIPLGGNRRSATRNTINSLAVFTLSGIWHGASWNFIIWGTLHGLLVGLNHLFSKYVKLKQTLLTTALGWLITFSLTSFCWIFFRAHSLNDAKHIVFNLFSQLNLSSLKFEYSEHFIGMNKNLALALLSILFLLSFEFNQAVILKTYRNLPAPSKAICCYILLMAIVLFGFYRSNTQFIYFQF